MHKCIIEGRWDVKEREGRVSCWRSWVSRYRVVMEINLIKIRNSEKLVEAGSSLGMVWPSIGFSFLAILPLSQAQIPIKNLRDTPQETCPNLILDKNENTGPIIDGTRKDLIILCIYIYMYRPKSFNYRCSLFLEKDRHFGGQSLVVIIARTKNYWYYKSLGLKMSSGNNRWE